MTDNLGYSISGPWTGFENARLDYVRETNQAMTEVFGPNSYYHEQFPLGDENWQANIFGDSYPRLLKIKDEVDPGRVFSCDMCVGSEDGF